MKVKIKWMWLDCEKCEVRDKRNVKCQNRKRWKTRVLKKTKKRFWEIEIKVCCEVDWKQNKTSLEDDWRSKLEKESWNVNVFKWEVLNIGEE